MGQHPFGKLPRFSRIVIQGWNHQVGDLKPHRRFVLQPRQRLQHRLKMRQRNFPVKILGKGLEIDVRRVDVIVNVVEGFVGDVAIGDHHCFQAIFPGFFADVDNIFAPDGRLVVGEGKRLATVLQRQLRHIFRRNMLGTHLIRPRFRNVPVLAEEAAHVAARCAHAENARVRQKMIQRLLFDGINLQRGGRTVSQTIEFSALIDANETESCLPWMYVAVAWAKIAVNSFVWLRFPPRGLVQLFGLLEDLQLFHASSSQTALYLRAERSARVIQVRGGNVFESQA